MLDEEDKLIVRCWSAVVVRDGGSTIDALDRELRRHGVGLNRECLATRMRALQGQGQAPS